MLFQLLFILGYAILLVFALPPILKEANLHCRSFWQGLCVTYFIVALASLPIILILRSLI